MPTYSYKCSNCEKTLDVLQKITDEPIINCPECKKKTFHRIPTRGAGVHFKGEGFYETDYKGRQ